MTPHPSKAKIVWTPITDNKGRVKRVQRPFLVGARLNPAQFGNPIEIFRIQFTGNFRKELATLLDAAKQAKQMNLPVSSLRAMLTHELPGVISMERNLGVSSEDKPFAFEVYSQGDDAETRKELKASIHGIVSTWCIDELLTWAAKHELDMIAMRVKKALSEKAIDIQNGTRHMFSNTGNLPKVDFAMVARHIADRLAGHVLFPNLGPCEVVVTPELNINSIELMTAPHLDEASKSLFSMVAKIGIVTLPYSSDVFLRVGVMKRVWASRMPSRSFNAPKRVYGYVMSPEKPVLRVQALQGEQGWDFGDEYKQLQIRSGSALPGTLKQAIDQRVPDKSGWWAGFPELTTLFGYVSQRSTFEGDEIDLFERVVSLLTPLVDADWSDGLLHHKPPKIAPSDVPMLALSDVGCAGASLIEAEGEEGGDFEDGEAGDNESAERTRERSVEMVQSLQEQNVRAIGLIHKDKKPVLWVFGMTERERELTEKAALVLFGAAVGVRFELLPSGTHGLKGDLEKDGDKASVRFQARVDRWKPAALEIAKYDGPRYVLIRAPQIIDKKNEDHVNYFAGIHAMTAIADANLHHLLPLDGEDEKALQHFLHRLQSALMDVFFAHAGVVFNAGSFVRRHYGDHPPAGVYGVQAVRSRARAFSGEKNVTFIMFSRLNCDENNGTTDIKISYQNGKRTDSTDWMSLAEGLRWLGKNRQISGDEYWLKNAFGDAVKSVLEDLSDVDPRAIVLVDWASTRALWKGIADNQLHWGAHPHLGNIDLAANCKDMTFVRLRSGYDTISLRAVKRTTYSGYWEGETLQETGQSHTEAYATTTKYMVETSVPAQSKAVSRSFGHFIVSMGYRKTVQVKRGLSCYRSMPRMKRAGKDAESHFYEQDFLAPSKKDAALPSSMEVTVMHVPVGVRTESIAAIVTGLRLGYAHFNDWTSLPAPLFFKRKVEDYIIRYSDTEPAEEEDSVVVMPDAPDPSEAALLEGRGVMQALTDTILDKGTGEAASVEASAAEGVPQLAVRHAVQHTSEEEGKTVSESLLNNSKRAVNVVRNLYNNPDPKIRRLYSSMMLRQARVHVQLPYFVTKESLDLSRVCSNSAAMRAAWRRYVAIVGTHGKSQPVAAKVQDWIMVTLSTPQSTYILADCGIRGPVLKAWKEYMDDLAATGSDMPGALDFSELTKWACAKKRDDIVAWLVVNAAQLPGTDAETARDIIESIPDDYEVGTATLAALEYFSHCVIATNAAYEQRNAVGRNFKPIHFKATVPPPPAKVTEQEQADGNEDRPAVMDAAENDESESVMVLQSLPSQASLDLPHAGSVQDSVERKVVQKAPPVQMASDKGIENKNAVGGPMIREIAGQTAGFDIELKDLACRLLVGADNFETALADVRARLDNLELAHQAVLAEKERQKKREQETLLRQALEERAKTLIQQIAEEVPDIQSDIVYSDNRQMVTEDIELTISALEACVHQAVLKQHELESVDTKVTGLTPRERAKGKQVLLSSVTEELDIAIRSLEEGLQSCSLFSLREPGCPPENPESGNDLARGDRDTAAPQAGRPISDGAVPATVASVTAAGQETKIVDTDFVSPPVYPSRAEGEESPVEELSEPIEPVTSEKGRPDPVESGTDALVNNSGESDPQVTTPAHQELAARERDVTDPAEFLASRAALQLIEKVSVQALMHHTGERETANQKGSKTGAGMAQAAVSSTPVTPAPRASTAVTEALAEAPPVADLETLVQSSAPNSDEHDEEVDQNDDDNAFELIIVQTSTQQHIRPLLQLIDKRRYALAGVHLDAINLLESNANFVTHHVVLSAALRSLQAVDCDFEIVARLDDRLVKLIESEQESGLSADNQDAIALGILAAGLVNMLFDDGVKSNTRWHVLGRLQHRFSDYPGLRKLLDCVNELCSTAIPITREMVLTARIGDGQAAVQEATRMRERAKSWATDKNIYSQWSHLGFRSMHETMFKPEHPIGRCIMLLAKGDHKALREAYDAARKKFDKPGATIGELTSRAKELKRPDGNFLRNMMVNIETTKKFIDEYLRIAEQNVSAIQKSKGKTESLMNAIYAGLNEATEDVESMAFDDALGQTYRHCALSMLKGVVNVFNNKQPEVCEPTQRQLLLIGMPMDRRMLPSMYSHVGAVGVSPACDPMHVLEETTRLAASPFDENPAAYRRSMIEAARIHLSLHRILPARMIKDFLGQELQEELGIEENCRKYKVQLLEELQNARQRVMTAMLLQSMQQDEASELLRKIEDIRSACDPVSGIGIGDPRCVSIAYPDFPQALNALRKTVLEILDSKLEKTKETLIQRLRECEQKHADRPGFAQSAAKIQKFIDVGGVSSLRVAHDAIELLGAGKLPLMEDRKVIPSQNYRNFISGLRTFAGGSNSQIEALKEALAKPTQQEDLEWLTNLDAEGRKDAVHLIDLWVNLCKAKNIATLEEPLADFFRAIGIGEPSCIPSSAASRKLHFGLSEQSFRGLKNIFLPPELGSQAKHIQGVILPNKPVEQEFNAVIMEQAQTTPTFVMGRATLTIPQRIKMGGSAKALIVDDNLVAYMAVHPDDRISRLLEIALLSFHATPYDDYPQPVPPEMFFGRQKELAELRNLNGSGVLFGGRRLGKSSLLDQILLDARVNQAAINAGKGELPIMVTLDTQLDPAGYGEDYLRFAWQAIYRAIITAKLLPPPKTDPESEKEIRAWLEREFNAGNARTSACYLLIDEADAVMGKGLSDGSRFIDGLQNLCDRVRGKCTIRYVITGLHNLKRMTTQYNSAFGKATAISLEPFTKLEDIREGYNLIKKPLGALGFHFAPGCEDLPLRIMAVCNFYPAFIQLYCRALLESMYNRRQHGEKEVLIMEKDLDLVEAKESFLIELQGMFKLNLDLDKRYKAIALVLAEDYYNNGSGELAGLRVDELQELCQVAAEKHFKSTGPGAMEALLEEMRNLTVLDKSGSRYRLRTPHIAVMLGDLVRIKQLIHELEMEPPSDARIPGESRIDMRQDRSSILFPMPSAWTRNKFGKKNGSELIVMVGNVQSGLAEIFAKSIRGEWKIGHDVGYQLKNLGSVENARVNLSRMPVGSFSRRFVAVAPTAWKLDDLPSYMEIAAMLGEKATEANCTRLILLTTPDMAWSLAQRMTVDPTWPQQDGTRRKMEFVRVPEWNDDALFFRLTNDQVTLRDSAEARQAILDATCGFTMPIDKLCRNGLTVEKCKSVFNSAVDKFRQVDKTGNGLASFYSHIGLPTSIGLETLKIAEQVLLAASDASIEDMEALAQESGLNVAVIRFFNWMGLIRTGNGGSVSIPALYRELLKS